MEKDKGGKMTAPTASLHPKIRYKSLSLGDEFVHICSLSPLVKVI